MKYPFVFYVKSLPPDVGACANAFVIRVLEKYRDDKGIHAHEFVHVLQWFQFAVVGALVAAFVAFVPTSQIPEYWAVPLLLGASLHSLLYKFCAGYRLWCEVDAYKEQSLHYEDNRLKLFAGFIAQYYKLNITTEQAYKELTT